MRRGFALALILLLLSVVFPASISAAPSQEKGLLITPLRQYLSVDAGKSTNSSFTISNLTDDPLAVDLSVKQFSVADYTYDYEFSAPMNDWLHLSESAVTLQSRQTADIGYDITVPDRSTPGGYYYTLFASATIASGGVSTTIQATDLVYLTVNGQLTTVSHLEHSSISLLNFGRDIPFNVQPVNTGNVYSFVYVSGQLHGLFVRPPHTSVAHVLMPGKVRALSDSIPSPILPGIYRATYGYKTTSNWVIQQSRWVVYIPPWSIAFGLAALLLAGKFATRRSRVREHAKSASSAAKTDTN